MNAFFLFLKKNNISEDNKIAFLLFILLFLHCFAFDSFIFT